MSCSNLLPEEALCLGTEDEDCNETYVVKPDDTCDIVADAQGVNSTMVRLNNPQIDEECTNLYIGEVRPILYPVQPLSEMCPGPLHLQPCQGARVPRPHEPGAGPPSRACPSGGERLGRRPS